MPTASCLLRLAMRRPFQGDVWLRGRSSDEDTFGEIVIKGVYNHLLMLAECRYIVDLGANIGLATRLFASTYPTARLYAIEPDPQNFMLLGRNVQTLISSGRCRIDRAAVWARDGRLTLGGPPNGIGFNSIRVNCDADDRCHQTVDGVTMASVIRRSGFPHIDLLKVDVEGAEALMLQGDRTWLAQVNTIAIEFHDDSRKVSDFDLIMAENGFRVFDSDAHTVVASRIP